MSAPPIGMISSTPNASASDNISGKATTATTPRSDTRPDTTPNSAASTKSPRLRDVLEAISDRPLRNPRHFLQFARGHQAAGEREKAQDHLGHEGRSAKVRQFAVSLAASRDKTSPRRPGPRPVRRTRARGPFAAARP